MKWAFEDTVGKRLSEYAQLTNNAKEWLEAGRDVSEWLVPGRGVYNVSSQPKKRQITARKVIDPEAEHALEVLVSGLKEGSCPSTSPWFGAEFSNEETALVPSLNSWLDDTIKIFVVKLREANYYSRLYSYIKEFSAFGTASWGVFGAAKKSLSFHVLTFGEYVLGTDDQGNVDRHYRTIFMNLHQLMAKFGEGLPDELLERIEAKDASLDYWYTVVEGVVPEKFLDMNYTRFWILLGVDTGAKAKGGGGLYGTPPKKNKYREYLKVEGVREFCYPTARFDVIGSDEYGVCPGHKAVETIKRLQEVVKSDLVAYHKSIRPPLNIPIHMKGQVSMAPDAHNFYINPDEIIRPAQDTRFDHQSAITVEGNLAKTLKNIFFNDVFLTTNRDPNASPLKARQVDEISGDKGMRIGPIVEQLWGEGIEPTLRRAYNILLREGAFPPVPEEAKGMDLNFDITWNSMLSRLLKEQGAAPIQEYLQVMGGVAQFDQEVLDGIDFDETRDILADIKGIPSAMRRPKQLIAQIRKGRAQAAAAQKEQAEGEQQRQNDSVVKGQDAETMKTLSEAGENLSGTFSEGVVV